MRRILWAVILCLTFAYVIGPTTAYAQTTANAQIVSDLEDRLTEADFRLRGVIWKKTEDKTVTKAEVAQVFASAFEYYNKGDYFTARVLFNSGVFVYHHMGWVEDEVYYLGDTYRALSSHKFCTTEPVACRAYIRDKYRKLSPELAEVEHAEASYSDLELSKMKAPTNLAQEVRQLCRAAYQRYRNACAAVGGGANKCKWHTSPECD